MGNGSGWGVLALKVLFWGSVGSMNLSEHSGIHDLVAAKEVGQALVEVYVCLSVWNCCSFTSSIAGAQQIV